MSDTMKVRLAVGAVVAYVIMGFMTYEGVKHAIWGEVTTGTVVGVSGLGARKTVTYEFVDSQTGQRRRAYFESRVNVPFEGEPVDITYIPGVEHSSGRASQKSLFMPILFGIITLGMVGGFSYWCWDVSRDKKPKRRRRR
ncbi:MAG: hypothetical protein AAF823_00700 [Planctomycetota bacterium]